jgi:hypothetical protein
VDYEETLGALLALIGRRVSVDVYPSHEGAGPGAVAGFVGVLRQATDMQHPDDAAAPEALLLQVGEGADASYLLLEQERFAAAIWRPPAEGQDEAALVIDVGGVRLVLDPNR